MHCSMSEQESLSPWVAAVYCLPRTIFCQGRNSVTDRKKRKWQNLNLVLHILHTIVTTRKAKPPAGSSTETLNVWLWVFMRSWLTGCLNDNQKCMLCRAADMTEMPKVAIGGITWVPVATQARRYRGAGACVSALPSRQRTPVLVSPWTPSWALASRSR